eukprot:CAMPEP_0198727390 /NCGR_PEP_ID=MMETSP1475-20131203/4137_1 /TAXON_ID= ORGANISM="Unidentified sp., Strain CCMP1999" /NCGR_SAMPLE_ID=MMETSP1475 /ASSEMBLY_ACC=CAM_ASM_001111 /LENGTH=854 /DNA_ID=CAMNT_0044489425 /DNA_START=87 /DNA_END=2651 /DNA_ORIENTATION=+
MASTSALPTVLPMARPGQGRKGDKVQLFANHFRVKLDPNVDVFQYSVNFYPTKRPPKPEELNESGATKSPPAFNRRVVSVFAKTYKSQLGNAAIAYDGRRSLFATRVLQFKEDTIEFVIEDEKGKKEDMTFTIQLVAQRRVADLVQAMQSRNMELPAELFQALDIALRDTLTKSMVTVGKSLFTPHNPYRLGEGCSAWRGFYQSLRPTLSGMTLNVDQKFTAFYDEQNVIEFAKHALKLGENRPFPKTLQDRERKLLLRALRSVKVRSTHTGKAMNHTIYDISRQPANQIFFDNDKAARSMSVAEYFNESYSISLRYPSLPCAKVHRQRDIFIPLEMLQIAPQKRIKALTPKQTQNIVRAAATRPQERMSAIVKNLETVNLANDETVKAFGITPNSEPVKIQGRILTVPSILYNGNRRVQATNGSWNMRSEKLLQSCPPLRSWGVIIFVAPRDLSDQQMNQFLGKLVRTGRENGINIVENQPMVVRADPNQAEEEMKRMKSELDGRGPKAQIIMCIKLNQDSYLYNTIKRTSDCVLGIPSQCALVKQVCKNDIQYCSNLCLKINAKLGGKNAFAEPFRDRELNHPFEAAPFMVIGADVTHPSPGATNQPSIAAMVGSVDRQMNRFSNSIRNQGGRKEIIEDIRVMFTELVREFQNANKGLRPQRIIIYRDGVSEGQFQQVLDWELWELRKACMSMSKDYRPPMTLMTVQKRHNTRLFPQDNRQADRTGNVRPGTIVDTSIVHPKYYDFFLCSHGGLQGTSKPACYTVLIDENKFTPDQLQHLTYRLCYNYARCCKSVSVVTAAYYAHHLAFRGRCFLEDSDSDVSSQGSKGFSSAMRPVAAGVHTDLSSTLYFI